MQHLFLSFWQHLPQHLDPIAFSIGFFSVRWYSLMYLAAFGTVFGLTRYRIGKDYPRGIGPLSAPTLKQKLPDFLMWTIIGLLAGARLGYALFYQPAMLLTPWQLINPFSEGAYVGILGMSYHGGLIGALVTGSWWIKRNKLPFFLLADLLAPVIPLGYVWGRLGNFLNGELFGRPTDSVVGMYFPSDPSGLLRHPSQLYEVLGEGVLIFALLWPVRNKPWLQGKLFPLYLILYGMIRFLIEFFRAPDAPLVWQLTRGQLLCIGMIVAGSIMMLFLRYQQPFRNENIKNQNGK